MKVVDVSEFYAEKGGGVKTYVRQKLAAGSALGHEVVIVAPGPAGEEERLLGGRIAWVKSPPLPVDPRYYILWRESEVHRILDRERPDVVEGSSPWTGGWFAARWRGDAVKTFIYHQDPVAVYPQTFLGGLLGMDRVDRLFYPFWGYLRTLSSRYDATITSGHWLAEKLKRFGLKRPEAVPFGIEKSLFSPKRRSEKVRAALLAKCGLTGNAALLVAVSRFHPEKRLGMLFSAFEDASRKRPMGLVVYGDGPLRKWVRKKAAGIKGIHIAGFTSNRDELADVMASADGFLHGSAAETYGLVVAEAVCSGLPVVVPDVGGAADLAGADYAEIYAVGKKDECAAAILRLLDRDRSLLAKGCAKAANEKIFTMDDHFRGLFALYQRLIDEKKGS